MWSDCRPFVRCRSPKVWAYRCSRSSLNLPERTQAQATIEAEAKGYEAEIIRLQDELRTMYSEYQAKANTWPDAIRAQKETEIQQKDQGSRV